MKIPTDEEIIEEVVALKNIIKFLDLQMGIGGRTEKDIFNRLNKILRMMRQPVRRIKFKSWIGKSIPRKRSLKNEKI